MFAIKSKLESVVCVLTLCMLYLECGKIVSEPDQLMQRSFYVESNFFSFNCFI